MIRSVFRRIYANLSFAKINKREISGSLGDLGTFLPIILGLAYITGLSFSAMLFWAGAANILTGLFFAIPMPVQPMKAIAAVALSGGLNANEVYASGIIMGLLLILIWSLKLPKVLENFVPKSPAKPIRKQITATRRSLKTLNRALQRLASMVSAGATDGRPRRPRLSAK